MAILRAKIFLVSFLFLATEISVATAQTSYPDHKPPCDINPRDAVADFSMPVSELRYQGKPVWSLLKTFGIKTIIRYYDWDDESLACKTLLNDEARQIIENGFSLAVVFQHFNGDPKTFLDGTRGAKDARRALELAQHNGQPSGTRIYFGVDGPDNVIKDSIYIDGLAKSGRLSEDFKAKHPREMAYYRDFLLYRAQSFGPDPATVKPESILPYVRTYFENARRVFEEAASNGGPRYTIGAYGSGLVCKALSTGENRLVDDCWLAQSTGWPGYDDYRNNGSWILLQRNPTYCTSWVSMRPGAAKPGFDFNMVRAGKQDFGQWSSKLPGTSDLKRPKNCPAL